MKRNNIFQTKTHDKPLAARMAPSDFKGIVGQQRVVDTVRKLISNGTLLSMLFHGPPGTGKTALARLISNFTESRFEMINAVTSNIADIRELIKISREQLNYYDKKTIVFEMLISLNSRCACCLNALINSHNIFPIKKFIKSVEVDKFF